MNIEGVTRKIVFRYVWIQTLETVVFVLILFLAGRWISIPVWLFAGACAVWVLKDIILFPFVWRAYDWERNEMSSQETQMAGMQGIVHTVLNPCGYIHVRGELWMAEMEDAKLSADRGDAVVVTGKRGHSLIVAPLKKQA
ncbi:MAG TPA: NfeD family protein [Deltaproteobacteria bacterium]|nr:NfeD family protein [Deltaproteobacteria bacterium]